jgi:WD40 repeat protein
MSAVPTGALRLDEDAEIYSGHDKDVLAVAWSPDGQFLASGGEDTTIRVWEYGTGKTQHVYRTQAQVGAVAFSPDGRLLAASGLNNTVQVWDVASGHHLYQYCGHDTPVHGTLFHGVLSLAFSPGGGEIASGSIDRSVHIWESAGGEHLLTYRGHDKDVHAVAWSPDGQFLASASQDGTVQLWEASTGTHLRSYSGHAGWIPIPGIGGSSSSDGRPFFYAVKAVAWSPDGRLVASGGCDLSAQVWDPGSGTRHVRHASARNKAVDSLAFSPDGAHVASAGGGGSFYTVEVWEAATGNAVALYEGKTQWRGRVPALAWSPDGSKVAAASDHTVRVVPFP